MVFVLALAFCVTPWASGPIALLGGFAFAYFIGHPFPQLNHKATGWLLKAAVVGLGFGMDAHAALAAGREGFALTAAFIAIVLFLGFALGKLLQINARISHLVASGTAICGGSAIAAVSPAVDASEKDISVALGTVFLLNAVALLLFPPIGHYLHLTQHQFGLWSAVAIHDTSSVVGAAAAYGREALATATAVKLARALWIIPVSLVSALVFGSKTKKVSLPWFIVLFVVAMLANTYLPFVAAFQVPVVAASKAMLVVTLFLIGAGLSVEKLKAVGWKPLALGVLLWLFVSVASLVAILQA